MINDYFKDWFSIILESKISFDDALRIFGVDNSITIDKLKIQYKKLAMKNHPDIGGSTFKMSEINEAYEILKKRLVKNFGIFLPNNKGTIIASNKKLTSLDGSPNIVSGDFYCNNNELKSLTGAPNKVAGIFSCSDNLLTDLIGAPSSCSGFYCEYNFLTTLKGIPKVINGDFDCSNQQSGKKFTEEYIRSICKVKGNIFV